LRRKGSGGLPVEELTVSMDGRVVEDDGREYRDHTQSRGSNPLFFFRIWIYSAVAGLCL
jgi:hypothetical protein